MSEVRTRFAPSPTGGLHIGGVRTALYSYLFAKKHGGSFILRIEDTDRNRLVEDAEQYIADCLEWCGIQPDESPLKGGPHAPYRQSERKEIYRQYAMQLVEQGHAYYAFDTTRELEDMRTNLRSEQNPSPQYDQDVRMKMRNSLTLTPPEVETLLDEKTPYVIRLKVPPNEVIGFEDMIRGEIKNESKLLDDKVLLKADGMPTYHLAVVVDDYMMGITHAFRGEEWLPSAPIHILLWRYLGWESMMPRWAHLPLILKPDGNGKLSKRDGERLGFPVFPLQWKDPQSGEITIGFKDKGFLPQAFINLLALLGWSSGEEREIFSKEEMIEKFSMDHVHKGSAKFDFEKAKWFNHEWIKLSDVETLLPYAEEQLAKDGILITNRDELKEIIALVKDRCILLNDFREQVGYFYKTPTIVEKAAISDKWNEDKSAFFRSLSDRFLALNEWNAATIERAFKELAAERNIKTGELLLPLRIMLVGAKFGPAVFFIAEKIGKEETLSRISRVTTELAGA